MFIGHFGLAFAAKKAAPGASLGALFMACQLANLVWPTLVLLGVEILEIRPGVTLMTPLDFVSYPYSHSLVALCAWGVALGLALSPAGPSRATVAIALALLVVSHWVLDVVAHRPDMPLSLTGSTRLGLGLWNSLAGTLLVELGLLGVGVGLYTRATTARDRKGTIRLWSLVGFLVVVFFANSFGPPPPSALAVAWSAQSLWLLVAWAFWVERHRLGRHA